MANQTKLLLSIHHMAESAKEGQEKQNNLYKQRYQYNSMEDRKRAVGLPKDFGMLKKQYRLDELERMYFAYAGAADLKGNLVKLEVQLAS